MNTVESVSSAESLKKTDYKAASELQTLCKKEGGYEIHYQLVDQARNPQGPS